MKNPYSSITQCSLWLMILLTPAVSVQGGIIVLKNGKQIKCDGPYEVKGKQVVYTDFNGKKFMLPATIVDLERSNPDIVAEKAPEKDIMEVLIAPPEQKKKEKVDLYEVAQQTNKNGKKPKIDNMVLNDDRLLETRYKHSTSEGSWDVEQRHESVCSLVRYDSTKRLDRYINLYKASADGAIYEKLRTKGDYDYPLIIATKRGRVEMVGHLLRKYRVRNSVSDKHGNTPLHILANKSISKNATLLAKILLNDGADLDFQNNEGKTPLECAMERGNKTMADLFVAHGAALGEAHVNDMPILMHAVDSRDLKLLRKTLELGTDPNPWIGKKHDPLAAAVTTNQPAMVKALFTELDLERMGTTYRKDLFVKATQYNEATIAEMLFETFQLKMDDGIQDMLATAVYHERDQLIHFLVAKGADPDKNGLSGDPLLIEAARKSLKTSVTALLEANADPNKKSKEGLTAFSEADGNHRTIIKQMIRKALKK